MAIRIQGTEVINDNREIVNVPNLPAIVDKPIPLSPADGETDITKNPILDGGSYHSAYDIPHAISRFQIADDDQFSNIVYDTGEIAATETFSMPTEVLIELTTYYWRVYYIDDEGVSSGFSDTFQFTTSDDPLPIIGTPYGGGFLVGVIDTVAGTIDSQDDYQTGERYALIVSPKSLEEATIAWDSQDRTGEAGSFTRWDGLSSTENILAKNDPDYQIFEHIRSIRSSDPVPSDGGSDWYVPAMDELELIYRNLKPLDANNDTATQTGTFPGSQDDGFNPSSDPTGSAYTATGQPFQTSVTDFQDGGAEAVDLNYYWSSTDADDDDARAWDQEFAFSSTSTGRQFNNNKNKTLISVRPVRRIPV